MSKSVTTRWYIGAWLVWLVAAIALVEMSRPGHGGDAPGLGLAYFFIVVAGLVMLATWIGALLTLASQRAWGWVAALVLLQVLFLGIVGMVVYAVSGRDDPSRRYAVRPRVT